MTVGRITFGPGSILTPSEWERANEGALRRHDDALRASRDAALHLVRSIADAPCACPDGLLGICPACRCRSFLGTPTTPPACPCPSPRLPQPDETEGAE